RVESLRRGHLAYAFHRGSWSLFGQARYDGAALRRPSRPRYAGDRYRQRFVGYRHDERDHQANPALAMLETFNIASLVDTARTYLAVRAGEAQLGALDTCILIMALSGALVAALNLWRISRREDFQERLDGLRGTTLTRAAPTRPQRPSWYHRLGAAIATT